jgi:hypothetical protein
VPQNRRHPRQRQVPQPRTRLTEARQGPARLLDPINARVTLAKVLQLGVSRCRCRVLRGKKRAYARVRDELSGPHSPSPDSGLTTHRRYRDPADVTGPAGPRVPPASHRRFSTTPLTARAYTVDGHDPGDGPILGVRSHSTRAGVVAWSAPLARVESPLSIPD